MALPWAGLGAPLALPVINQKGAKKIPEYHLASRGKSQTNLSDGRSINRYDFHGWLCKPHTMIGLQS